MRDDLLKKLRKMKSAGFTDAGEAAAEIERLRAENAALVADAERYRWWRELWCQPDPVMPDALVHAVTAADLNAAIDTERSKP